ncbi:MAG TPA: carbohydrate-binding protein [Jiangellaceae bacterium]|nr:carbohydrate-binding protein [Jiangellaceae bacterium]
MTDIDLRALDDPALAQLRVDVLTELERRETLASAPERADRIARDYLGASGTAEGEEWVQPSGAHDAYPQGWEVVHEGVRYRSLISGNVWIPGDPNDPQSYRWWENLDEQPDEGEWDPNGTDYAVDETVTHDGTQYRCIQAHTSQPGWSPDQVPALWEPVE